MSFEDERRAIEARFADNFTATPIKYENVPFDAPDDAAWVALSMSGTRERGAVKMGLKAGEFNRYPGVIRVDIYIPEDTGTAVARQHADTIRAIFKDQKFSAGSSGVITTRAPRYETLGVENGWYHGRVTTPYYRDANN